MFAKVGQAPLIEAGARQEEATSAAARVFISLTPAERDAVQIPNSCSSKPVRVLYPLTPWTFGMFVAFTELKRAAAHA